MLFTVYHVLLICATTHNVIPVNCHAVAIGCDKIELLVGGDDSSLHKSGLFVRLVIDRGCFEMRLLIGI